MTPRARRSAATFARWLADSSPHGHHCRSGTDARASLLSYHSRATRIATLRLARRRLAWAWRDRARLRRRAWRPRSRVASGYRCTGAPPGQASRRPAAVGGRRRRGWLQRGCQSTLGSLLRDQAAVGWVLPCRAAPARRDVQGTVDQDCDDPHRAPLTASSGLQGAGTGDAPGPALTARSALAGTPAGESQQLE
jgi:hypothetical protein